MGSTSKTNGASASTQTYYPFGAIKTSSGTPTTDYGFTGQKRDATANLMYYGARYYNPALARFIQPDTIVPNPMDPQSLNRYSYVRNNPVNLVDPTGHEDCAPEDNWCWENRWYEAQGLCYSDRTEEWTRQCKPEAQDKDIVEEIYHVQIEGDWSAPELNTLLFAFHQVVNVFNEISGYGMASFQKIWGGTIYRRCHGGEIGCKEPSPHWRGDELNGVIRLFDPNFEEGFARAVNGIIHEMGHAWDEKVNWRLGKGMAEFIGASPKGCVSFLPCSWRVTPSGYEGGLYIRPPNAIEDFADSFMTFVVDFTRGGSHIPIYETCIYIHKLLEGESV